MAKMTTELHSKIASIAGSSFTVTELKDNALSFENVHYSSRRFDLYFELLSEDEILEVAGILKEIFDSFPRLARLTEQKINLNLPRKSSADFVRSVLSLQGSAFHKFLLLTSGRRLLWEMNVDQVIALAQAKQEVCSLQQIVERDEVSFRTLKQLYILPGVSSEGFIYSALGTEFLNKSKIVNSVKLMAFISNNSEISFSEHLKLDFAESIATQHDLPFFGEIESIQRLLKSRHKELAESMNASQLSAFNSFITKSVIEGSFPERILRNRAAALASASFSPYEVVMSSVFSLLSDEERSCVESEEAVDDLDFHLTRGRIGADTPLVVYAALAEVLAVKGLDKAFEVARELKHFKSERDFDLKHYEATVALMDEALNPENDDFPFSWYSQLSEHAWVLTSHLSDKELTAMV